MRKLVPELNGTVVTCMEPQAYCLQRKCITPPKETGCLQAMFSS